MIKDRLHKGVFIVGTDTDVGKTYVSALLMKKLLENGVKAVYFKGALSGAEEVKGNLIPGDAKYVCEVSGLQENYNRMVSYSFKTPVSPHLASRLENKEIFMSKIVEDHMTLCEKYSFILAEGSGGIICPIKITDKESIFLEDIIKALNYEVIVVTRSGVGTINHTCLTIAYLKSKAIPIRGIIFNEYDKDNGVHRDNAEVVEKLTGINVLAYVPKGSSKQDINIDISTIL